MPQNPSLCVKSELVCILSFGEWSYCTKKLEEESKALDLKLGYTIRAPEGKKIETLCLFTLDLDILVFWRSYGP